MESSNRGEAHCVRCGRELPDEEPAGLEGVCVACLLEIGAVELGIKRNPVGAASKQATANPTQPASADPQSNPIPGSARIAVESAGHLFGDYEMLEKIGQGGMGIVYKARQISLNRLVALKLLPFGPLSRPEAVERFRVEARAAAALRHPNIVAIHEVGQYQGQPYFSMDYIAGRTLADTVRDQPLPASRAAGYLKSIAEAIHYAHEHGIIHRDLKPSNILVDAADQPQVTDFGLAKRLESPLSTAGQDLTLTGEVLGSPNFIAPEQAAGRHKEIGPASDIYSLGGLLYYLLTRQPPFQADTLTTLLKQVCEAEPVAPRRLNPSIPRDLETICLKCLEKEPRRRYATAGSLAAELGRFLRLEPIQARPVGMLGNAWKWCRRKPLLAAMSSGLVLSLLTGLVSVSWEWRKAEALRQAAQLGEYAADIPNASSALNEGRRRHATGLLDKYSVGRRVSFDPRHWEWRYLRQLCQDDESFKLAIASGPNEYLVSSGNGRIAALKQGSEVTLFDLSARRRLISLSAAGIQRLSLSTAGDFLATAGWATNGEAQVRLWDAPTGDLRRSWHCDSAVRSLTFSQDAKLLAWLEVNRTNGVVVVTDLASGRRLAHLVIQPPRRTDAGVLAFCPNDKRLVIGGDYGGIRTFNWQTGEVIELLRQTTDGVMALAVSPKSELLAAGFGYVVGTIYLWDLRTGQPAGQLAGHTEWVNGLALSPEGERLASVATDETIRIWDLTEKSEIGCIHGAQAGLSGVAFLPDGQTVASADQNSAIRFWRLRNSPGSANHTMVVTSFGKEPLADLKTEGFDPHHPDPRALVRSGLAFDQSKNAFIVPNVTGLLTISDARSFEPIEKLQALGSNNWGVALSPEGRWLAYGNAAGKLSIVDWPVRRVVTNFDLPFECYGKLQFSLSGNFLIVRSLLQDQNQSYRIWHVADWAEVPLEDFNRQVRAADLSPDDTTLAGGYSDQTVKLWRFPECKLVATLKGHPNSVHAVAFAPDGTLASACTGGTVRLWDLSSTPRGITLRENLGSTWAVAFSADSRRLLVGGNSTKDAVELWDLKTRRQLLVLAGEGDYFVDVGFSPDGNLVQGTSLDGKLHLWRAPSWEEIATKMKTEKRVE